MYLLRLRQADIARRYKQRAPRQPTATRWKAWPGPKLLCIPTPQYFFFFARFNAGACFIQTEAIYEIAFDKRATKAKTAEATTMATSHGLKVDFDMDIGQGICFTYTRHLMTLAGELRARTGLCPRCYTEKYQRKIQISSNTRNIALKRLSR